MAQKARRTILGDSTNTYYNYCPQPAPLHRSKSYNNQAPSFDICSTYAYDMSPYSENTPTLSCRSSSTACSQSDYYSNQGDASSTRSSALEESSILNCAMKSKKKMMTDETKYKTEMCKNWLELGKCNYGKKCKFAHGKHEMMEKSVTNRCRYKSKNCNSFFTSTFCPYGVRCMFAHEQRTVEEINSVNRYGKYLQFPELLEDGPARNRNRLPVFQMLEQSATDEGASSEEEEEEEEEEEDFFPREGSFTSALLNLKYQPFQA